MVNNNLKETLSHFDTLLLAKVKPSEDLYQSKLEFISNSFEMFGIKNINTFYDLINSINRSSPMVEGIGYYEYCNRIKEGIFFCLRDGFDSSFILPIQKEEQTLYFLMNMNKDGNELYVLFIYFDNKSGLYNFEELSKGTFKDELTGLFNYKTLVSHISENNRRGYLLLFDLNGFKQINDTHGHEIGDEVLRSIANYLISIASSKEVFYRRSGDEFMILVFEQNLDYVLALIDEIERHIEHIPQELKKEFKISAAFGILELNQDDNEGYELRSKLTDLAMYQAKKAGKLYHYISHEDAIGILKNGDLDQRIKNIAKK